MRFLRNRATRLLPLALPLALSLIVVAGLSGCTQVYDDTKGWGNDVESWFRRDVLKTIPPLDGEQQNEAPEPAMAALDLAVLETGRTTSAVATSQAPQSGMVTSLAPQMPVTAAGHADAQQSHNATTEAQQLYPQMAGKAAHEAPADRLASVEKHAAPAKPAKTRTDAADHGAVTTPAMALHLSSNKTKEGAMKEWIQLKTAFPNLLKDLHLDIERTDLGEKGVFYRVLAGSFENQSAAREACSQLRSKKQFCAVMAAPKANSHG
jgi:hypothetical protein